MAKPNNKKREQKAKQRELAKKKAKHLDAVANSEKGLIRLTRETGIAGHCYVNKGYYDQNEDNPKLAELSFCWHVKGIGPVMYMVLVDRTCLGVKSAMAIKYDTWLQWTTARADVDEAAIEQVAPEVARSIVYHAVDYAASLGFSPCADFFTDLVGPRPEPLVDTILSRPSMPIFVVGPDDEPTSVVVNLINKVGPDKFKVLSDDGTTILGPGMSDQLFAGLAKQDGDDTEGDPAAIVTEGVENSGA